MLLNVYSDLYGKSLPGRMSHVSVSTQVEQ